jgi:hypothetical protein
MMSTAILLMLIIVGVLGATNYAIGNIGTGATMLCTCITLRWFYARYQ